MTNQEKLKQCIEAGVLCSEHALNNARVIGDAGMQESMLIRYAVLDTGGEKRPGRYQSTERA